jgi:hypothetical protein
VSESADDRRVRAGCVSLLKTAAADEGHYVLVDGEEVGQSRLEAIVPMVFSADETRDVGSETGSLVGLGVTRPRLPPQTGRRELIGARAGRPP